MAVARALNDNAKQIYLRPTLFEQQWSTCLISTLSKCVGWHVVPAPTLEPRYAHHAHSGPL